MMCMGGIGHGLRICLDICGIEVWLGTFGVAALMIELHQSVHVLSHFTQFCFRKQVHHPPWDHVPPHVWTDKSNSSATEDEGEDEADVCTLCCQKRSTITVCGECPEYYYDECIDAHTCGEQVVY